MLRRAFILLLPLLLFPAWGDSSVRAQTATGINDLTFGNVLPGVAKTISKRTAGAAAEYSVTGNAGDPVLIDFTLPTHMTSGANSLLITFGATDCAIDSSDPGDQSSPAWDDQDPRNTLSATLGSGGLTIWLGALVQPSALQPSGSYSAEIILTVSPSGT
jgi:hypothetical protein